MPVTGAAYAAGHSGIPLLCIDSGGNYAPMTLDASGNLTTSGAASNDGLVSTDNSSTSVLAKNASFTGTGVDALNYASVIINVYTDAPTSANNGLLLQFSSDNTNWDVCIDYKVKKNEWRVFHSQVKARYCRVVYNNGDTAQTTFRLQTLLHRSPIASATKTIGLDEFVSDQIQGAVVTGVRRDLPGTLVDAENKVAPLQVNKDGELRVDRFEMQEVKNLLKEILAELRIANLHNRSMTGEKFVDRDTCDDC